MGLAGDGGKDRDKHAPAHGDVSDHNSNKISFPYQIDCKLTRIGKIIDNQWNKIPSYFENITLDEYVLMPDHFHGIIVIRNDPGKLLLDEEKLTR